MAFAVTEGTIAGARPRAVDGSAAFGIDRLAGIANLFGRTLAYDAIYRSQPQVRTVVDFLARQVASIKLGLYERLDEADREEVVAGPAATFYRRPNPKRSRFAFYRDITSDLLIYDAITAVKMILPSGRPVAVRIPPTLIVPVGKSWLEPEGFALLTTVGKAVRLGVDQVIYVHGYSPTDPRSGVSPIETLRNILAEDEAAAEYRAEVWNHGARMSGYIKRPVEAPDWSDPARERFRSELTALFGAHGPEAGGTAILEEGMEYEQVSATAVELEYVKARELNRSEVCAVFHVDELLVGGKTAAGSSVTAEARRGMYADTLSPLLTFLAEELEVATFEDLELDLDDGRHYLEHNLEAKLRGHFLDQAEVISRSVGAPWLTRNEGRTLFNRARIDGGDELIVPLNVVAGGRASPADTAPGTPGLGQASAFVEIDGELRPIFEVKALPPAPAPAKADPAAPGSELDEVLAAWLEPTVKLLDRWAARARRTTVGRVRRGDAIGSAFDADRWARELAADALALAIRQAAKVGGAQLRDLDVDDAYNVDGAEAWLEGNAKVFGEGATDALLEDLRAAYAGKAAKADDELEETPPADRVDEAFGTFAAGRLLVEAATRVATVGNFARYDAAQQANAGTKTWRTNSAKPRSSHAGLNGTTVPIGDTFPNGALWPGDPILPAEERANCACAVTFNRA